MKKKECKRMKVSKNVGRVDGFLRITLGLSLLGFGITRRSDLMTLYGATKTAEGLTRFCPLYHVLGITTINNRFELTNDSVIKSLNRDKIPVDSMSTE